MKINELKQRLEARYFPYKFRILPVMSFYVIYCNGINLENLCGSFSRIFDSEKVIKSLEKHVDKLDG